MERKYGRKTCFSINSIWLLGLIAFFTFSSCDNRHALNRRIKKEVTRMIGKTMDFGIKVDEVSKDTVIHDVIIPTDSYRIVTFIPVKSCTKCVMKIIPVLDSIKAKMNKSDVTKLIVITDANVVELQQVLNDLNVTSSVYMDKEIAFLEKNHMTQVLERNKTVLVDKQDKIVLVGEPYYNSSMKELYLKAVSE